MTTLKASVGRTLQTILIALALIAIVFGGWRLLAPVSFYAFSGLDLPAQPGLLSEVRGAGGIMLFAGLIAAMGAFSRAWTRTAIVLAFMLYSAIVLGRVLGLAVDGVPVSGVLTGLVIESIAAVIAGVMLFRDRA